MNDVVATGGFMLHYNQPFTDLYMKFARIAAGRVSQPFCRRN
jgi:hypothetical protein